MVKAKIKSQEKHHETQDSKTSIVLPTGMSASGIIIA
jgi:hypothetical protein